MHESLARITAHAQAQWRIIDEAYETEAKRIGVTLE
jgi:hypothetical protein